MLKSILFHWHFFVENHVKKYENCFSFFPSSWIFSEKNPPRFKKWHFWVQKGSEKCIKLFSLIRKKFSFEDWATTIIYFFYCVFCKERKKEEKSFLGHFSRGRILGQWWQVNWSDDEVTILQYDIKKRWNCSTDRWI